jgi:hypothetical protein
MKLFLHLEIDKFKPCIMNYDKRFKKYFIKRMVPRNVVIKYYFTMDGKFDTIYENYKYKNNILFPNNKISIKMYTPHIKKGTLVNNIPHSPNSNNNNLNNQDPDGILEEGGNLKGEKGSIIENRNISF